MLQRPARTRRRHPASGGKDLETSLIPLTVAMDSIRLWSSEEQSGGEKTEGKKSGETAERGSLSASSRTDGG